MERLVRILMKRDKITQAEARALVHEAKNAFDHYVMKDDLDSAEHVCEEYLGLEQDYLVDLIF